MLKLWLLSRADSEADWDEYEEAVVVARTEEGAKNIHPSGSMDFIESEGEWGGTRFDGTRYTLYSNGGWVVPRSVRATLLGDVTSPHLKEGAVVIADFRAG